MERRKEDPIISDIHTRIGRLEEVAEDIKEIREWMFTVTRVFRVFEMAGCFMSKWAIRIGKLAAATAAVWLCIKGCASDVRAIFLR